MPGIGLARFGPRIRPPSKEAQGGFQLQRKWGSAYPYSADTPERTQPAWPESRHPPPIFPVFTREDGQAVYRQASSRLLTPPTYTGAAGYLYTYYPSRASRRLHPRCRCVGAGGILPLIGCPPFGQGAWQYRVVSLSLCPLCLCVLSGYIPLFIKGYIVSTQNERQRDTKAPDTFCVLEVGMIVWPLPMAAMG